MKFTITKKQILKAIETEPLKPGLWIEYSEEREHKSARRTECNVCAVGGVLRSVLPVSTTCGELEELAGDLCTVHGDSEIGSFVSDGNEHAAIRKHKYLTALSIAFERVAKLLGAGKKARGALCAFVIAHFPDSFEVETEAK